MKHHFSLKELKDVLNCAFDHILPKECNDIIIAFGNTGCGKSTILGSMLVGPEKLYLK